MNGLQDRYRCLLAYGNQLQHELVDRRLAVRTLMRLASGHAEEAASAEIPEGIPVVPESPGAAALVELLAEDVLAELIGTHPGTFGIPDPPLTSRGPA